MRGGRACAIASCEDEADKEDFAFEVHGGEFVPGLSDECEVRSGLDDGEAGGGSAWGVGRGARGGRLRVLLIGASDAERGNEK